MARGRCGRDDRGVFKGVVDQHWDAHRHSGVRAYAVIGNVHHRCHGQRQRGVGAAPGVAVGDAVANRRHAAVPVGHRREGVCAGAAHGDGAVAGQDHAGAATRGDGVHCAAHGDLCHGERVAVGIRVVAQHVARHWRVFGGAVDVRVGNDRVVGDVDRDGGCLGHAAAGDGVREAVRPHVTGAWRVANGAVGVDGDRAVARGRCGRDDRGVFKGVVDQHRDAHRHSGVRAYAVIGNVHHRCDGNVQYCSCRATIAVRDRVGHGGHNAVPVGGGREGVAAALVDDQRALARKVHRGRCAIGRHCMHRRIATDDELRHRQRVAIGIGVCHVACACDEHVAANGGVLRCGSRVVVGNGWRVGDCVGKALVDCRTARISGGDGDGVDPVRARPTL